MKIHQIEDYTDDDCIQLADQFSVSEPISIAWIKAKIEEDERQQELLLEREE